MIPIVLLLGALIGRWWFVPAAGLAWVVLLVSVNNLGFDDVPIAAALAIANAALGVVCHKCVMRLVRHSRGRWA